MYKDYQEYQVEDFVWDDDFRQWVLFPTEESNTYWTNWLRHNQSRKYEIEEAALLVKGIKVEEPAISNEEKQAFITGFFSNTLVDSDTTFSRRRKVRWLVAASVFICLFASYVVVNTRLSKPHVQKINPLVVSTLSNALKTVELPDKSIVTLDKNSELTVAPGFQNLEERKVYLKGNAFFEITHDKSKPFYVFVGNMKVEVVGTSFTIKSNNKSGNISVAVKTGKVKVSGSDQAADKSSGEVVLTRNQTAEYNIKTNVLNIGIVDEPEISEKEFLNFNYNAIPVDSILNDIEKGYSIKILYSSSELRNKTFSGNLEGKGLMEKLSILCKALNCSFYKADGTITIKPNPVGN